MDHLDQSLKYGCREKTTLLPDGRIHVEQILPQVDFPKQDFKPFTYECDFQSMLDCMNALRDGTDDVNAMTKLLYSEPNVKYPVKDVMTDKTGSILSKVEATILRNEDVDALVNPSRGTIVRAKKAGYEEIDVLLTSDRDNVVLNSSKCQFNGGFCTYSCKEYEGDEDTCVFCGHDVQVHVGENCLSTSLDYKVAVQAWGVSVGLKVNVDVVTREELPFSSRLYVGLEGSFIPAGSCWVGLEYNPYVANVTGLGLLQADKVDDGYMVTYQRKMLPFKFKYKFVHDAYREHGMTYMQRHRETGTLHHSVYNVIFGSFRNISTYVAVTPQRVMSYSPHRLVSCRSVEKKSMDYIYYEAGVEKTSALVVDVCRHGKIIDIVTPAFELSTRMSILRECGHLGCSLTHQYRVASSYFPRYVEIDDDVDSPETYDVSILDFPSKWMFVGQWRLRAYPAAIFVNGAWSIYPFNKPLDIPSCCDQNLFVNCDPQEYYASGQFTQKFVKAKFGVELYIAHRQSPILDKNIITGSPCAGLQHRKFLDWFIYDCKDGSHAQRLMRSIPNSRIGDFSKMYDFDMPANAVSFLSKVSMNVSTVDRVYDLQQIKMTNELHAFTGSTSVMLSDLMVDGLDEVSAIIDFADL